EAFVDPPDQLLDGRARVLSPDEPRVLLAPLLEELRMRRARAHLDARADEVLEALRPPRAAPVDDLLLDLAVRGAEDDELPAGLGDRQRRGGDVRRAPRTHAGQELAEPVLDDDLEVD